MRCRYYMHVSQYTRTAIEIGMKTPPDGEEHIRGYGHGV
jgi:hypothetical protein